MRWLLVLALLAAPIAAPAAVFHDAASNAQRIGEFLWNQANEVKKYGEMLKQVQQGYEMVTSTWTLVEQGVKNLDNLPKGMNVFQTLDYTNNQTSAILARIQWMGFTIDRSSQQFEQLYRDMSLATTPQGRALMVERMRAARMEMNGVSMQVQNIRETFTSIYERLSALLGASSVAQGMKAMQQIQLQQQAIMQQQQQAAAAVQAVQARLFAMEAAERMVREDLAKLVAKEEALRWYATQPVLSVPGHNGFMLTPAAGR